MGQSMKLGFFLVAAILVAHAGAAQRPNIVFILADDLGWDDVSFHGSTQIPTPNLDTLAYDGVLLSSYYVQPICTPSRSALMTGKHPIHLGTQHDVIHGSEPWGVPLTEKLLPQYLKELNYSTHIVGKWHLGFYSEKCTPMLRGFDSHFGFYLGCGDYYDNTSTMGQWHLGFYSEKCTPMLRGFDSHFGFYQGCGDYYDHTYAIGQWHLGFYNWDATPMYRGFDSHMGYYQGMGGYWDHTSRQMRTEKDVWGLDFHDGLPPAKEYFGQYSTEIFTTRAEKIISEHDTQQPLFLYVPHQAVHSANPITPLEAPWKYLKNFDHITQEQRRQFAGMVSALDDSVGNITKALAAKGILNNTVIVFSTDNGGPAAGFDRNMACNYPLRGIKHTLFEGGVRGAGFVWSPLLKKSGYTSSHMLQIFDWLPTLLSAAGYDMDKLDQDLDGMDMWHTLSTNPTSSPRTEMLHNIDNIYHQFAIRVNDMKLVYGPKMKSWSGWYQPGEVHPDNRVEGHIRSRQISEDVGENTQHMNQADRDNTDDLPDASIQDDEYLYVYNSESAPSHMFESDLTEVLQSLGRPAAAPNPFVVKCGEKPANASTNCDVSVAPCLYNITADPCEYNNLASMMPDVVTKLLDRLSSYNVTSVPPGNKAEDPAGYPINHGGLWVPWL